MVAKPSTLRLTHSSNISPNTIAYHLLLVNHHRKLQLIVSNVVLSKEKSSPSLSLNLTERQRQPFRRSIITSCPLLRADSNHPSSSAHSLPCSSPLQTFDSPTRKQKIPCIQTSPDSKSVKVESWPRLYISDFKIRGKTEPFQHAKEYADSLDTTTSLDPANSTIQRHALTHYRFLPCIRLSPHEQQTIHQRIVGG